MTEPKRSKGKSLLFWLSKKRHKKKRRRRGDKGAVPRSIEEVLRKLEPGVFEAQRQRCPVSHAQWQEVAGIRIADRSEPRRLDPDGTLLITVTSSVWAQELSMLSMSLTERLRAQGHRVKTLRFVIGNVTPPRRGPQRFESRVVPAPDPIPAELERELASIDDDELRGIIEKTAASSLARYRRFGDGQK